MFNYSPKILFEKLTHNLVWDSLIQTNLIGSGTTGSVYKYINKNLNSDEYAVKFLKYEEESPIEINFLFNLNEMPDSWKFFPKFYGYVKYLDEISQKEVYALVFELANGNLKTLMKNRKKGLSLHKNIDLLDSLLGGLSMLKKNGLAHQNLKPENILYFEMREKIIFKLTDFGEIKIRIDSSGKVIGSPTFFSPEINYAFLNGLSIQIKDYNPYKWDTYSLALLILYSNKAPSPFLQKDNEINPASRFKEKMLNPLQINDGPYDDKIREAVKIIVKILDFKSCSKLFASALMGCLEYNPLNRYDLEQAKHKFKAFLQDNQCRKLKEKLIKMNAENKKKKEEILRLKETFSKIKNELEKGNSEKNLCEDCRKQPIFEKCRILFEEIKFEENSSSSIEFNQSKEKTTQLSSDVKNSKYNEMILTTREEIIYNSKIIEKNGISKPSFKNFLSLPLYEQRTSSQEKYQKLTNSKEKYDNRKGNFKLTKPQQIFISDDNEEKNNNQEKDEKQLNEEILISNNDNTKKPEKDLSSSKETKKGNITTPDNSSNIKHDKFEYEKFKSTIAFSRLEKLITSKENLQKEDYSKNNKKELEKNIYINSSKNSFQNIDIQKISSPIKEKNCFFDKINNETKNDKSKDDLSKHLGIQNEKNCVNLDLNYVNEHKKRYVDKKYYQRKSNCEKCLHSFTEENLITLKCTHNFCKKCLVKDCERILGQEKNEIIVCPYRKCDFPINNSILQKNLPSNLFLKYQDFYNINLKMEEYIKYNRKERCYICSSYVPETKNCKYIQCTSKKCANKQTIFCYFCGEELSKMTFQGHFIENICSELIKIKIFFKKKIENCLYCDFKLAFDHSQIIIENIESFIVCDKNNAPDSSNILCFFCCLNLSSFKSLIPHLTTCHSSFFKNKLDLNYEEIKLIPICQNHVEFKLFGKKEDNLSLKTISCLDCKDSVWEHQKLVLKNETVIFCKSKMQKVLMCIQCNEVISWDNVSFHLKRFH